ncbi:MAG: hypothetical protein JF886_07775 [Candidatus Dormibacteraeota bacterium]|uniref:Uncharacterized protein n=1 Tax=Candidatus Aeolococcus gillhamiae TaxID=3127015 RepID=A0A2W5Z065_9BACT|nr:hypothetical protein [Candidatus Dormibacteraeota bacterium]PZR77647.1 MAG: hypothetical protein DLM65_15190 [Candidatus Dormibacter sp. RRmetagenome_bin12]
MSKCEDDLGAETKCNPDCVYVPARGWWCRRCGAFRDLDDTDLCADCRRDTTPTQDVPVRRRSRARR